MMNHRLNVYTIIIVQQWNCSVYPTPHFSIFFFLLSFACLPLSPSYSIRSHIFFASLYLSAVQQVKFELLFGFYSILLYL